MTNRYILPYEKYDLNNSIKNNAIKATQTKPNNVYSRLKES